MRRQHENEYKLTNDKWKIDEKQFLQHLMNDECNESSKNTFWIAISIFCLKIRGA